MNRSCTSHLKIALAIGLVATLLVPWIASANVATQLDYFRDRGAAHCPDENKLRQAVEARLGYDPFIEWSPRRVVAEIVANGSGLMAILRLVEGGGIVRSRSELSTDKNDCAELVAAVALAIAIHLDPDAVMRVNIGGPVESTEMKSTDPDPHEESVVQPTPNAAPPISRKHGNLAVASAATTSLPKPATPIVPAIRLGGAYLQELEPHYTLALKAGASVRYSHFQAITELFAGFPRSQTYPDGGIRSRAMSAAFMPCANYRWLSGCAEAMVDLIWVQGVDVPASAKATLVHVALGTRVEATWVLNRTWAAIVGLDLLRNLSTTSLRLQQAEVWKSPAYRYALGFTVEMRFP